MLAMEYGARKRTYIRTLMMLYAVIFVWSAISPKDYAIWFLEILGVLFIISVYVFHNSDIQFTTLTNTWFFIAMSLITIGAHYSFPDVPVFDQFKGWYGVERNNFDKLGHLVQGILPVLIGREILVKKRITRDLFWTNFLAFCVAMSVTAVYELIEWMFIVLLGNNEYTYDVLGTQGYVWDAQSDMLMACLGAILTIVLSHKHFVNLTKD
jgi:putative membrane protein